MRPQARGLLLSLLVVLIFATMGCEDRCMQCSPTEPTAPECAFTVSPLARHFPYLGGTGVVAVSAKRGCSWTGASNVQWIGIAAIDAGSVSYVLHVNTGAARTGTMTIAGQTVTITQDAAPVTPPVPPTPPTPPPPTPTPSCAYAVQESAQQFDYRGGNGGFSVSASRSDCPWNAVANVAWIAITGGSPGSGNGTVSYLVAGNAGAARTGTISVAGKTVTVKQAAP